MLNRPPINEMISKTGCRYMLVAATAKRAKSIMREEAGSGIADNESVERAVQELYAGNVQVVDSDIMPITLRDAEKK